jgi:glutaredoxin-related protein
VLRLILYSTSACHLCEQALELLQSIETVELSVEEVDISDSDELFKRYGVLIPVLRREDTGAELNWPFNGQDIEQLLRA